jgi:hypothetical protein
MFTDMLEEHTATVFRVEDTLSMQQAEHDVIQCSPVIQVHPLFKGICLLALGRVKEQHKLSSAIIWVWGEE